MMRTLILGMMFFLSLGPFSASGEEVIPSSVAEFLESRQIVCTINFGEGSSILSPAAMREIDRVIPLLRKIDPSESLIRIEGFASPGGGPGKNVPMSMKRARAVTDYIQSKHPLTVDLSLTGFGAPEISAVPHEKSCRAEIAVYDNIWKTRDLTIEKVVQR